MEKDLETPIEKLTNIGPYYSRRLKKLDITTLEDLLYHFPARYEDLRAKRKLGSVVPGEKVSVEGAVWQIRNVRTKYAKLLTLAVINDGTASIQCVWFNQPFLLKIIKAGQNLSLAGKVDFFNNTLTLMNPEYEFRENNKPSIHTSGLIPIYPETARLGSKWLRNRINTYLANSNLETYELLPTEILEKYQLPDWTTAMKNIHFPKTLDLAKNARDRFAFEELFLIQLSALKRKNDWQASQKAPAFTIDQEKIIGFVASLPFDLTNAQKRSLREILNDLKRGRAMNRLLQGDVGSGKTVVAAIAAYITSVNGFSTVLMAPTEILAYQHFQTLDSLLKPYGIKVGLQTSSKKTDDQLPLTVGTHALIFSKNLPENLGLIIVDEQHRFGVEQRTRLRQKGVVSHFLTMSATPIPRTMALTLFGDLDLSVIDELPSGRQKIKTFVVPKEKRDRAYDFIRNHVRQGRQVFIICPLIDPSETLGSVKSAVEEWERLEREIFPDLKVGLLHGRLKTKEKNEVLERFKKGQTNILVATPVVEVGIDVPNATIMMIEASERFGLAQLHQMRGRVGRGAVQSFCLLFTESRNRQVIQRLKFLEQKHIGLELAEIDLKLRGPGELYGTLQHGIPSLKVASLSNTKLIEKTRGEALKILENALDLEKNKSLKERLERKTVGPD